MNHSAPSYNPFNNAVAPFPSQPFVVPQPPNGFFLVAPQQGGSHQVQPMAPPSARNVVPALQPAHDVNTSELNHRLLVSINKTLMDQRSLLERLVVQMTANQIGRQGGQAQLPPVGVVNNPVLADAPAGENALIEAADNLLAAPSSGASSTSRAASKNVSAKWHELFNVWARHDSFHLLPTPRLARLKLFNVLAGDSVRLLPTPRLARLDQPINSPVHHKSSVYCAPPTPMALLFKKDVPMTFRSCFSSLFLR